MNQILAIKMDIIDGGWMKDPIKLIKLKLQNKEIKFYVVGNEDIEVLMKTLQPIIVKLNNLKANEIPMKRKIKKIQINYCDEGIPNIPPNNLLLSGTVQCSSKNQK